MSYMSWRVACRFNYISQHGRIIMRLFRKEDYGGVIPSVGSNLVIVSARTVNPACFEMSAVQTAQERDSTITYPHIVQK